MALGGASSGGGAGAIKAGAAFVTLFVKNQLTAGLNSAAKDLKKFGTSFGSIGRKIALTGIAAGSALSTLFAKSVGRSAEFGALSLKFGDTAENLSALSYAAGQASLSNEELFAGFKKFPAAIVDAQDETSKLGELFKTLGLDAKSMAGQPLTDSVIQFADALNASGLGDVDRLNVLQDVFGKSGQQFNEFLAGGSKEIRSMMEEAKSVGAVISSEQAAQAKRVEDTFSKTYTALKSGLLSVGDALLPNEAAITRISDAVVAGTASFRVWMAANREVVLGIGLAIGGVTALGVGMMVLGKTIALVGAAGAAFVGAFSTGMAALGIIKTIVLSPILAIPAAIVAAGAAWLAFTDSGGKVVDKFAMAISNALTPTWENLKDGWKGVVSAVGRGDFEMAIKIGLATVQVEWVRFTNFIDETWNKLLGAIDTKWTEFTNTKFVSGLNKIGEELETWFDEIIDFDPMNPIDLVDPLKMRRIIEDAGEEGIKNGGPGKGFIKATTPSQNQVALNNAQLQLQNLLRQNAALGGAAGGVAGVGGAANPITTNTELSKQMTSLQNMVRSSVAGSAGLGMFGGNSVGNRIADNTKETAANVEDLLAFVRNNGLVYQ